MRKLVMTGIAAAGVVAAMLAPGAVAAPTTVIYDSTPNPLPGNVVSQGYECCGVQQFGDQVSFAGSARELSTVTVIMSSWACQSGHWDTGDCASATGATSPVPVTLNLYDVGPGNTVGTFITGATQTFQIPYRPSASTTCGDGRWYDAAEAHCYNGYATPITFTFAPGTTLPSSVIYGISYTTSTNNGPGSPPSSPTDPGCGTPAGCFVNSLNVGEGTDAPSIGTRPGGDSNYLNSSQSVEYCDHGGTGTFRYDAGSGCYFPLVQFNAVTPGPTCPAGSTSYSDGTINGNLTVPSGQSYCLSNEKVTGDITVQKGGSLTMINGSTGGHDVKGNNPASVTIDSSTVNHDVVFSGATGSISVTNSNIVHDLNLTGNKGSVTVSSDTIGHDLNVKSNTGGTTVTGNTVSHIGTCSGNTGFAGSGNSTPNAASCNSV